MSGTQAGDFAPHVGKAFLPGQAGTALVLTRIEPQPGGFILLFEGPAAPVVPEGLYDFSVADGAAFSFYIMPIHTPVPGHQDYQAVFN